MNAPFGEEKELKEPVGETVYDMMVLLLDSVRYGRS